MNEDAPASASNLRDRALHRRAVEAVIWGMPAVNHQLMYEAAARGGGPADNKIIYWPKLLDWTNQTLTPNPDVIYVMPFFKTRSSTGLPRPWDPTLSGPTWWFRRSSQCSASVRGCASSPADGVADDRRRRNTD
jgi:hypothetical protein